MALDCHVVLTDEVWTDIEAIKSTIKDTLAERFGVSHSSLEFEHTDRAHEGADLYGHGSAEKRDDHAY